jgi:tetratricopeptide (TPR) repeat protein
MASSPKRPWYAWHPARLFYLFVLAFIVGVPANYLFSLVTTGPASIPPFDQLYLVQVAQAHPAVAAIAFVVALGLAVVGWRIDRRQSQELAQLAKDQRQTEYDAHQQEKQQALSQDVLLATTVQNLHLRDYKQGAHPQEAYFADRPIFAQVTAQVRAAFTAGQGGVVLVGQPMVGKTRMVLQALRSVASQALLLSWPTEPLDSLQLRAALTPFQQQTIALFIDDLQDLASRQGEADRILQAVRQLRSQGNTVITLATCRSGDDADIALKAFRPLLETEGLTQMDLPPLPQGSQEEQGFLQWAQTLKAQDPEMTLELPSYNQTPGSILLGLRRREDQLRQMPPSERTILQAIALLRTARITPYNEARVRRVAEGVFELPPTAWLAARTALIHNDWVTLQTATATSTARLAVPTDAYLDLLRVIDYPLPGQRQEDLFPALATALMMPQPDADALMLLSGALQDDPLGSKAEQYELALQCVQAGLNVIDRQQTPQAWADAQVWLGNAYQTRIRGERAENLEQAIAAYEQALQVRTREADPTDWAGTQNNLGNAYLYRIRGERAENLEQAIAAYEQALQVRTREADPTNWALTQNNLGNAYQTRIRGERAENLEQAIAAYEQALQVRTREADPTRWAMTQNNLGAAYQTRIRGERAENLERAIAAYEQALQVRTREADPTNWAMTQNNLGNAYADRIRGERAENLEQAIAAYELALQVLTREADPTNWAGTQNNLGSAYANRIRGERAENLEQAIAAYEQALQVRTREADPTNWAQTQNNLGNAYRSRIRGEQAENLEQAIAAYELALQVLTREADPTNWAQTQNNLGNAYLYRIRGERAENLEQAIAAYEQALQVRTREADPTNWAMTQNNLGAAYGDRIRGERAENLEQAIAAYELALQVSTREADPTNWALTQNNLGNAYADRIRGERAENLEQAIAAYEQALQVRTREADPTNWAQTTYNLALVYAVQAEMAHQTGDQMRCSAHRALALETMQATLAVYTEQSFPADYADAQQQLARIAAIDCTTP